jgi:hypothetical protein
MSALRFVGFKQHNGHPVWINPEKVVALYTVTHKGCIGIDLGTEGEGYTVQGDPSEVIRKLGGGIFVVGEED